MYKIKLIIEILILVAIIFTGCTVPTTDDDDDSGFDIRNIQVTNLSESSVKIEWETTDSSQCALYYGISDYGSYASDSLYDTKHEINLYSLVPSSEYRYKIIAESADSRFDEAENLSFDTMSDTVPPVITNIELLSMTSNSITLAWETNEATNSIVKWGETRAYNGMETSQQDSTTIHYTTVSGLEFLSEYHFKFEATDMSGNTASSPDTVFQTSDLPVIKFIPDTIRGNVGDTIDVAVQLEVENLAALSFLMEYDNIKIDILKVEQGAFFIENSGNIFQVENPLVTQVEVIAAWMINYDGSVPVGTGADGIGNVCVLKIILEREGESTIRFIRDDTLPAGRPDGHPDSQLYDMSDNYMTAHWYSLYIDATPSGD